MLRNVRLIYIHNLLTDFRFQAPFAVIYFQKVAGSYTLATTVLAVEVIAAAVLDIPTGVLSDKIGRKYTLAMGSISAALALACYALAHSVAGLLTGAFFFGLSLALFSGNNNALLYESLKAEGKEKQFHHYQGRTSSMFQLGLGTSALLASFIVPHGLRIVYMCGIVPQILAVIVSFFIREPRHVESEERHLSHVWTAMKNVYRNPRLRLLTITHSISYGFNEAMFMFTPAFINIVWPSWAIGIFRTLAHTGGFSGFWFAGRILDRIKAALFMAIASGYWLVSELIAVLMANVISPLLIVSGSAFFGTYMTAFSHILQEEFTDKQRATMSSVISFASSLACGFAAILLGALADRFGIITAMIAGILGSGTALPVYIRLYKKHF